MKRIVYLIDDDVQVRMALTFMLRTMDVTPWPFAGGADFLEGLTGLEPGCILLDMRMPDIDGLAVLERLAQLDIAWPVIAMTGHGDVTLAVNAMKRGAIDFLEKPIDEEALSEILDRAFGELSKRTTTRHIVDVARDRIAKLTARERMVLQGVAGGRANKVIASDLGISVRTVEMHRENLLKKLGVRNGAEAAAFAIRAGLSVS